jgi:hypothetical protein
VILAVDAGKSVGWSLSIDGVTARCGVRKLGTWFRSDLDAWLQDMREIVTSADLSMPAGAPPPLMVVERAPPVVRGGFGGGKASAFQTRSTVRGLVEVEGAIAQAGIWPGWAYPWEVEPDQWRGWYGWRGKRAALKIAAVELVKRNRPDLVADRSILPAEAWTPPADPARDPWPAADLCDAIALGEAAAAHRSEAPAGPGSWRRKGAAKPGAMPEDS